MKVFQVVMEGDHKKEVIDIVEYVQAADFAIVANAMVKRAEEMGDTLKSIKYVLTVAETIYPEED